MASLAYISVYLAKLPASHRWAQLQLGPGEDYSSDGANGLKLRSETARRPIQTRESKLLISQLYPILCLKLSILQILSLPVIGKSQ
ncbi:hypothetical protein [Cyclobacterium jeungdonense]|uniref:Uncharacterized protein n=1 Tax=Cyclobacterium jeungdonense TaxID=708087 RepID=A0ABT8CA88_9BACT|nr:hypothetical protein [Cyclobacterium jeungdonense]MDN3689435.1 hypothetical protein [Cyclobacterium jeungdonense]